MFEDHPVLLVCSLLQELRRLAFSIHEDRGVVSAGLFRLQSFQGRDYIMTIAKGLILRGMNRALSD
jgi:hypothetical protein